MDRDEKTLLFEMNTGDVPFNDIIWGWDTGQIYFKHDGKEKCLED